MASKKSLIDGNELIQEMRQFLALPEDEISPRMLQRVQMELMTIQNAPEVLFTQGAETDPEAYTQALNIVNAAASRLQNQFGIQVQSKPQYQQAGATQGAPPPVQQRPGTPLRQGMMTEGERAVWNTQARKEGGQMLNPNMMFGRTSP